MVFWRQIQIQVGRLYPSSIQRISYSPLHIRLHHCSSEMANDKIPFSADFFLRQLFSTPSCTYTYLLADTKQKEAILIDPVLEEVDRDAKVIEELGLKLKYALNTHMHADHVTGTGMLKKLFPGTRSIISKNSGASADEYVSDGDTISFGRHQIKVASTPGHTNGCVTYILREQGLAFTGDAVLVRGCGRTDFQEGSPTVLYKSVHEKIFSLPDNFTLYPAHDYKGMTATSVGEEKHFNPRLAKPLEEFINIMNNLNLPYPKMIDKALPANKVCGIYEVEEK